MILELNTLLSTNESQSTEIRNFHPWPQCQRCYTDLHIFRSLSTSVDSRDIFNFTVLKMKKFMIEHKSIKKP